MIIVSACLLGENCKYSGGNNKAENVIKYLEGKEYILVCPEQLGKLSTPRDPSEIITEGNKDGNDVLDKNIKVLSNKGVDVIDCGVPVLSMHAPYEVTSKYDIYCAYETYRAFWN